ncbi:MAG: hypothetical protein K6A98_07000 [Prevotella sp.]|nr:hypothetical protein [Prevotella sp.]
METKRNAGQDYYVNVATKISPIDKIKVQTIAENFKMSLYELVQSLILAVIRYFDKETPLNQESEKMINAFINVISATKGSFNPISPSRKKKVKSAILFIQRKDGLQPQPIAISKDNQGRLTECYNIDKMLADYLKVTEPEILKVLEDECKIRELFSISHTLHQIILEHRTQPTNNLSEEIKALFDDIRIPSGLIVNEDVHYKRKQNRGDYTQVTSKCQTYRTDL